MANPSIHAAFERMWQHIVAKLDEKANADTVVTKAELAQSVETSALILSSPSGTRFQITVDNDGELTTTTLV